MPAHLPDLEVAFKQATTSTEIPEWGIAVLSDDPGAEPLALHNGTEQFRTAGLGYLVIAHAVELAYPHELPSTGATISRRDRRNGPGLLANLPGTYRLTAPEILEHNLQGDATAACTIMRRWLEGAEGTNRLLDTSSLVQTPNKLQLVAKDKRAGPLYGFGTTTALESARLFASLRHPVHRAALKRTGYLDGLIQDHVPEQDRGEYAAWAQAAITTQANHPLGSLWSKKSYRQLLDWARALPEHAPAIYTSHGRVRHQVAQLAGHTIAVLSKSPADQSSSPQLDQTFRAVAREISHLTLQAIKQQAA